MPHVASFFAAFILTTLVPGLLLFLALRSWRRLPREPWVERARRLHPIRQGHGSWVFLLPFTAIVVSLQAAPDLSVIPALLGGVLGASACGWPLDRAVFPEQSPRSWLHGLAVHMVLRLGWLVLVLAFALAMPSAWSTAQLAWAAAFLVAASLLSSDLIYRVFVALGLVRPARERLAAIAATAAAEAGVKLKSVWEIDLPSGFAAALIVQRALLFSTTSTDEHDDEELLAVCRHEVAHLREGPGLMVLRIAQLPLALLPFIFTPAFVASYGGGGVLPPLFLWLLINRLFASLSLRLEKRADAHARGEEASPAFARALERLYRRNLMPAALAPKATRTHPDLYDRMLAAGIQPDYPRPAPPAEMHWVQFSAILLSVGTMFAWMGLA
jgi:Zn-dependent protease with chaperone function